MIYEYLTSWNKPRKKVRSQFEVWKKERIGWNSEWINFPASESNWKNLRNNHTSISHSHNRSCCMQNQPCTKQNVVPDLQVKRFICWNSYKLWPDTIRSYSMLSSYFWCDDKTVAKIWIQSFLNLTGSKSWNIFQNKSPPMLADQNVRQKKVNNKFKLSTYSIAQLPEW